VFGDDAARIVVFVKAFQPLMAYRSYHPDTVTRYVTQVKNNVSKIMFARLSLFECLGCVSFACRHSVRLCLQGWPAPD